MNDVAAVEQRAQPLRGEGQHKKGSTRTPGPLRLGGREFAPGQPLVMAIVNRTPDSFYRPGLTWDEGAAPDRVRAVRALA
jgi:hypothetical protein